MIEPITVRLTGIEGLAAAAPSVLGFTPTESLVLMCLAGPRRRAEMTMRVDLAGVLPALPGLLVRAAATGADELVALIYTEASGWLPYADVADAVVELSPVPVADALLVRSGRVWSYTCVDRACCPVEGKVMASSHDVDEIAAAHAFVGRQLLPDRDAVFAELLAPQVELAAVAAAVDVTDVARFADPRVVLTDAEVVGWVNALADVAVRDNVLRAMAQAESLDAFENLLDQLVHRVPAGRDADVCTLAAIAHYLTGDGLRAAILLARARTTDPAHMLAMLASRSLDAGVKPSIVRTILAPA